MSRNLSNSESKQQVKGSAGDGATNRTLKNHKKIFGFHWKQFYVLFYFIDQDIIKSYF